VRAGADREGGVEREGKGRREGGWRARGGGPGVEVSIAKTGAGQHFDLNDGVCSSAVLLLWPLQ